MPIKSDIQFTAVATPITEAITKFGGQPVWIEQPQWPLSRSTGQPMRFIGQIRLERQLFPEAQGQMAYLFMTDEESYVDGTWEADGGENAVIIQPAKQAASVAVSTQATGPTLYRMVEVAGVALLQPRTQEYAVSLSVGDDPAYCSYEERSAWSDEAYAGYAQALDGNKIGGTPIFLQNDEFPDAGVWQLLLQLDSVSVPFSINFGDSGVGYAFIDPQARSGKFLWQSA